MKILFPHKKATKEEIREILNVAIEGRKRVKDQLLRIDSTYSKVKFGFVEKSGQEHLVKTLEEKEYPQFYYSAQHAGENPDSEESDPQQAETSPTEANLIKTDSAKEGHLTFEENQKGVTFDHLFGSYLKGAKMIEITDPYIRLFFQARNLMEFVETVAKSKDDADFVHIHLRTIKDEYKAESQEEFFKSIQTSATPIGINFTWEYDGTNTIHARHIITDTGWKISLDRGLDIYQQYDMNNAFSLPNKLQKYRSCKAFEVTYIKK